MLYVTLNVAFGLLLFFSKVQHEITRDLQYKRPIVMTPSDTSAFQSAVNCWVCEKPLDDDRVRDHCHVTGKMV